MISRELSYQYIEYDDYLRVLFSFMEEFYGPHTDDPLPDYRSENEEGLKSILSFVKLDYYSEIATKAAYLFVSIIKGHIYPNGNKRLAVVTMLYFLIINGLEIDYDNKPTVKDMAIFVADAEKNQSMPFDDLKLQIESWLKDRLIPAEVV